MINVTMLAASTGQSESIPLQNNTTLHELADWARALFGWSGRQVQFLKDGQVLHPPSMSLQEAGVTDGDLLVAQEEGDPTTSASFPTAVPQQGRASTTTNGGAGGGQMLDFSALLAQAGTSSSTTPNLSRAAAPPAGPGPATAAAAGGGPTAVYYDGMNLDQAIMYNPHPSAIVPLLLEKDHLWKELNYHNPTLADKLRSQRTREQAIQTWREEMVKGGIQQAMRVTQSYHKEREMQQRLAHNPDDVEAKEYFHKKDSQSKVEQQFVQMMEEYPESLSRVLMLYVEAKINGHKIQAFCDSGAQATIISKKLATECGLLDYIDTRMSGTAVGVGTAKILGRIHIVQLQIGDYYFPCSVTVMDDVGNKGGSETPFLLGLDMMKRHTCQIDLERGVLKFRLAPGQYMETPFLHEKDLELSQGGTKGFDADKANRELMELSSNRKQNDDDDEDERGHDHIMMD